MIHESPTGFRLSPVQRRLWSLRKHRSLPAVEALVAADARLDRQAVEGTLDALARDHEILRTRFAEAAGVPVQCVSRDTAHRVEALRLDTDDPAEVWAHARSLAGARAARDDELTSWIVLVSTAGERDYVYVRMSPLVADRRSLWLVARALSRRDGVRRDGAGDGPLQYADIAEWKEAVLEADGAAAGRLFWASQQIETGLSQSLPCVRESPPSARFAPARVSADGVRLPARLAAADTAALEATALGCWAWLCARSLDEDAALVGVVSDSRAEAETHDAIGPMTAPLPVRVPIDRAARFEAFRAGIAGQLAAARTWQDLFDWDRILTGAKDPSRPPSCPVLFELADERTTAGSIAGELCAAGWRMCELRSDTEPYRLGLVCVVRDGALVAHLDFDPDVVEQDEASRLLALFERLLATAIETPDLPLSGLEPALSAIAARADRALNAAPAEASESIGDSVPSGGEAALAHGMFERQAASTPDAIAIVDGDARLTFAELNRLANRTARLLRSLGVCPEERVGILLPRSTWMVASVVAVMKAGGAFVPLDGMPRERLLDIARRSGIRFVFAERGAADELRGAGVRVLTRAEALPATERMPASNVRSGAGPGNLAYVLFTSGSTGAPKGVMVPHAGLVNYLAWARRAYVRPGTTGTILFSPLDFDFTLTALLLPLVSGRAVLLAGDPPLECLARSLGTWSELAFLKLTPAHVRALRHLAPNGFAGSGLLVLGGEALAADDVRGLGTAGTTVVVNEYGPTEAVVGCCVHRAPVAALSDARSTAVPIGRPIRNTRMHLLTTAGDLSLPGAPGEIAIGGEGLARGYIGRPDLTAASFRPDAFAADAGARAYLTGDLARLLPDGTLMFLGRADDQVKLQGFRIELEEVAHVARQLPFVRDCAALLVGDGAADRRLALAVSTGAAERFDREQIRAFLAERLPGYMVPAVIARLDAIPMTANGKVDRRALAHALSSLQGSGTVSRRPATQAERDLAGIWQQVLKAGVPGVDDNFFTVGGDSIRSIQVLALARSRGYELSLADVLEAPTIAGLARRIGGARGDLVPPEARVPFGLLHEDDRARVPPQVEDAYPMTSMQQGMLFHSEWDRHIAAYHDIVGVHVEAPYEREALERSLRDLIAAHPILRTVFDLHTFGEPLQLVLAGAEPVIEELDLRDMTPDAQESAIDAWMAHERGRRFSSGEAPPYRFVVQRRGVSSFQFNVCFHHALLDGWSTATLLLELLQRYSAAAGLASGTLLPAPRSAFRDYVWLERAARQSEASQAFWTAYLNGAEPTRYGRRPPYGDASPSGVRRYERTIAPELHARAAALARELGVPLKTVLLAAHAKAVATLTTRREIVTGVVSSGRVDEADGERALGLFLNTLPLRVAIPGRPWRELVREIQDHETRWTPHRRVPLADIVRSAGELFDTAFNYVHYHLYGALEGVPALRVLQTYAFEETSFALLASFAQAGASDRLTLLVDVDAARVPAGRLAGIADLYEAALDELTRRPGSAADGADLLSPHDESRLREWTCAAATVTAPCAHRQALAQARRTPDAVAVVAGGVHLSYRALVREATRVAGRLSRLGAGPEQVVALDMDRGLDLTVVHLATLLAGAAYLYIDRNLPEERRRFILSDSRPRLVVTSREPLPDGVPEGSHVVFARELFGPGAEEAPPPARSRPDLDTACYLVYTSGSTGVPKGIVMRHGPVASLVAWQVEQDGARALRTLQYTTLSFDVSFQEIFSTWAAGGTLVLLGEEERERPRRLWDLLCREAVERLFLPCAALRQLATVHDQGEDTGRLRLRHVITAGDVLHLTPDLRALLADHPGVALTNQYGPAEAHVVTSFTLEGPSGAWPELPGIGTRAASADVHVLNGRLRPVPIGSAGEICLGGDALSRGYMRRPDLTAERFVPDPRSGRSGARLYRTGDLARFDDDGRLEFLGRNDHQVKVLGHRVELEEIETAMAAVPEVGGAAVRHRIAPDGESRLVAYLVPRVEADAAVGRVRAHLERSMPRYMIPARFVVLEALPRTITGKIDRRRLPWPDDEEERRRPSVAPADATEAAVLDVWKRALKRDDIGVEDDFFEAGGHSLTATRIVLSLRALFQIDLPIREVFEIRTVRAMARRIPARARARGQVKRVPRDRPLALAPQQENWWRNEHLTAGINPNNISFVLRFTGSLHLAAMEQALAMLQQRHEGLRTAFVATETGEGRAVVRPPECARPRVAVVDLAGMGADAQREAVEALWELERTRPFDLTSGELCRATLVRLAPDDHVVLFSTHHLVCDGWSIGVLGSEFSACYAAALSGTPPALPGLPFQYVDFAQWQREWLEGPDAARQLAYWRRQLAPPLPDLFPPAAEHELADVYLSVRGRAPFTMDAAAVAAARAVARRERCTLFATCLAALKVALAAETRQPDVRVGTFAVNRGLQGAERVVGLFTNAVCLRSRVEPSLAFGDLVRAVHATIAGAMSHQDLPFEVLAGELEKDLPSARASLFQVLVVWHEPSADPLHVPGAETRLHTAGREGLTTVLSRNALDLKFELVERPATVDGSVTFALTRFTQAEALAFVDAASRCLGAAERDRAVTVGAMQEAECGRQNAGGQMESHPVNIS